MLLLLVAFRCGCAPPRGSRIVIGAKNFTEQVVLGELLAQEIEAVSGQSTVERRFYLAGSYLCQQALVSGRIDGYVEYTGTALTAILKQPLPPRRSAAAVFATVRGCMSSGIRCGWSRGWASRIRLRWWCGGRMRDGSALKTISDVTGSLACGWAWGMSFRRGRMAWPGWRRHTGCTLGTPRVMDLGLLYRALAAHQVDMVAGNSTDGPIRALGFRVLEDDRHYFPPYEAVPLVREDSLGGIPRFRWRWIGWPARSRPRRCRR